MKKSFLILLSFVILLTSVLTVMASAETDDLPDDMFDDDVNVTYDAGTTATTKGGILNNVTGDGIGGFVGGVVESVFQDEDVSEQVNDKVEGVGGIFSGIFDSFKDIIPSTNKQTTGSNFFDPITPAVTGGFNSNLGSNSNVQSNTLSSTNAAVNGEFVDYNTTVIPYAKPTAALNPGDKSDGVKWLQWILIYTECGLQNPITGDYDDATAAAVKTLQLKYGMTVDGIASSEVIEKAEQMYNDYINGISGQGTSSPAVFNTVGNNPVQGNKPEQPVNITTTIIIVVLIVVWIFAIAAVCIIVHIKRKNITLSEDGEIVKPEKEKKSARKTKGILGDSVQLKPSDTLQSLKDTDDDIETEEKTEEPKKVVKSLYDRRIDDLHSLENSTDSEVKQEETEATEETEVIEDVKEVEEPEEPVEQEAQPEEPIEQAVQPEEVTEEVEENVVVEEKVEAETQQEISQNLAEAYVEESSQETETASKEASFDVVDVPVNFNIFNEFDYSDDEEIRPSLSLREMKQRKLKLEEQAKKDIVNSSDDK
jgi:peptidoglycan hydrolase-like protein with peptidoglycan-binding domain